MSQRTSDELQVVVCELGAERYGLDIACVYEIIRHQAITAVPKAPPFVEGIINLRGRIVPVVDLHGRLGMAAAALTRQSRIVVADAAGTRIGLVVDGVSEVLMIPSGAIEETPAAAVGDEGHNLQGIARLGDELVLLLDLEGLFRGADALLVGLERAA